MIRSPYPGNQIRYGDFLMFDCKWTCVVYAWERAVFHICILWDFALCRIIYKDTGYEELDLIICMPTVSLVSEWNGQK